MMCADKTHTTTNFTSGYDLTLQPTQFSGKLSTDRVLSSMCVASTQQVPFCVVLLCWITSCSHTITEAFTGAEASRDLWFGRVI